MKVGTRAVASKTKMRKARGKGPIEREAKLAVDRNRWWLACILLVVVVIILLLQLGVANRRFANNVQVSWVKLYPTGEFDIEVYDKEAQERMVDFFPATRDSFIRQFIERRYSEIPYRIQYDYSFVAPFLTKRLRKEFLSKDGVDAIGKAAKLLGCVDTCNEVVTKVTGIDHYSKQKTKFGNVTGMLNRTNVFVVKRTYSPSGELIDTERGIVSLEWRVKSKEELRNELVRNGDKGPELLAKNPIGLEILKSDYLVDTSSNS